MKIKSWRIRAAYVGAAAGVAAFGGHKAFHSQVCGAICASIVAAAASRLLRVGGVE